MNYLLRKLKEMKICRWNLITFNPHPSFISSIVVENDSSAIKNFNLDPQFGFIKDNQFSEK